MKQKFKASIQVQTNGRYYFSDYIYCKSIKTITRTKAYKYYDNMLNNNTITGFKIVLI